MTKICERITHTDEIRIIPIGDVHRGSPQFNEKLFKEVLELVKNNDNYYIMLMGDLIDNAIKSSKSDVYTATETPEKSMDWIVQQFLPLKDKILAITTGNHEERTIKEVGVDLTRWCAKQLGLEDKYAVGPFILFIGLGRSRGRSRISNLFSIFGTHGAAGSTTVGTVANKLLSLSQIMTNADVYVMGHSHKPMGLFDPCFITSSNSMSYKRKERLFVCGQSFLNYEGSYGEKKLYKPTSHAVPIIVVKMNGRKKVIGQELFLWEG